MRDEPGAATARTPRPPRAARRASGAARALAGVSILWAVLAGAGPVPVTGDVVRQLVLVGIVLGHRAGPVAVIEDRRTGQDGFYHVGDAIAGAAVVAITADRAVLRLAGHDVELRLAVSRSGGSGPVRIVAPGQPPRTLRGRMPILDRRFGR